MTTHLNSADTYQDLSIKPNGVATTAHPPTVWAGTVIVADPQQAVAQLFVDWLLRSEFCRRGIATSSIAQTLEQLQPESRPLILAETRLADGNLARLVHVLSVSHPAAKVVALTHRAPRLMRDSLEQMGVQGLVLKSAPLDELRASLRDIAAGVRHWSTSRHPSGDDRLETFLQLSGRQVEVFLLLAEGLSVKQVAQRLQVSIKTIDSLKYRLMKQFGFHDRVQLTRFAIREGLIDA